MFTMFIRREREQFFKKPREALNSPDHGFRLTFPTRRSNQPARG